MVRQRLDALIVLNVTGGEIKQAFLAHPMPDSETPWMISSPLSLDDLTEQDFDDLVEEWEAEISEAGGTFLSQEIVSDQDRVLLGGMQTDDISPQQFEDGLGNSTDSLNLN